MNETAKKILGFIERLPETYEGNPLRQWALEEFDEDFSSLLPEDITVVNFIDNSFEWEKTSQLDGYWHSIYTKLRSGELKLLPEVAEAKEFVWTDELVKEFALQTKVNGTNEWVAEQLYKFKSSKQRVPLFTTEDGVQVFEGSELWYVETDFMTMHILTLSKDYMPTKDHKCFATEAAAKAYVRLNKPRFSLEDVKQAWRNFTGLDDNQKLITELEKLKP